MLEKDLEEIIKLKRPIILIYKNDEQFNHGMICFSSNGRKRSNNVKIENSVEPISLLIKKGFYVLIQASTQPRVFRFLIEKLFNHFNQILFYNTNFTNEQMVILEESKKVCGSDLLKYRPSRKSNKFFEKYNEKNYEISYVFTSAKNLSQMRYPDQNSQNFCNSHTIKELTPTKIEENERRKHNVGKAIRQIISQESAPVYCINTPLSLQSIIRAQYFQNASCDEVRASYTYWHNLLNGKQKDIMK